jgi:hypothetical protein
MLTITTRSGSRYLVAEGTVTRLSEIPVEGFDGQIVGEPMLSHELPRVGYPWRYRTADGPFITTRVVAVHDSMQPLARVREALFGPITVEA